MTTPATDPRLLGREEFKRLVFARDGGVCVVCRAPGVDAHHILERRLWPDGGYYLDNGVTLCAPDHLRAEETVLSCEELRQRAGIRQALVPPHLYRGEVYDKWGNPVLPSGQRLRGELFGEDGVQKALTRVLHLFTSRVKYPRTFHLPWSPGVTDDDRVHADVAGCFHGREVVVTAKMDGENTTMYRDYLHARAVDFQPHPSRSRVRALHGAVGHEIPDGWRVCGENLYAQHTIHYSRLPDYFLVFSVWNDANICLSWDDTVAWAALLNLRTVPVLYRGPWDERLVRELYRPVLDGDECEG